MSFLRLARTLGPVTAAAAVAASSLLATPVLAAGTTGLTVARDAATGRLRAPTAAESAELARRMAAPTRPTARPSAPTPTAAQPAVHHHRNGTSSARLTNEFASHVVMVRQSDGSLKEMCIEGGEAARKTVADNATPAPAASQWATE